MDISRFVGHDGVELAYREVGSGRPLILLHGFMGTGSNWLNQGPAETLVEQGFCLFLPDFRGHGKSMKSHDPLAYPPDVLADDGPPSSSTSDSALASTTSAATRSAAGSWCGCSRGAPNPAAQSWPGRGSRRSAARRTAA
jgi:pimeloyl-ACP methyl ester carboxylesterase